MKHGHFGWLVGCALLNGVVYAGEGWPMFRGPQGDGSVIGATLPLHWSETENVRWKTAIPHLGWSTPAVRDGRVWVTSATTNGQDYFAFCVDAASGKILFEKHLFHCDQPEPLGNAVNCYAAPSPAVDEARVYVHFGTYGTACLDAKTGETLWTREDLKCRHYRGPGSSVLLWRDLLILTYDGVDVQYVTALDTRTGKTVWKTDRVIKWNDLDEKGQPKREGDFRKAFATPLVLRAGGREQLISLSSSTLFAYDPGTGKELWRVVNTAYTPSVSPVFDGGLVLAVTGRGIPEMLGIRPDGTNDVTGSHVAWRMAGKDVPLTPSPVVLDGLMYMLADHGVMTCLEAATGQTVWRERVGGSHIASLIHDGKRIYAFGLSGKTAVLRAGRTFEKMAENSLDTGFMASPAVDGDALILRTKTHLYRIEATK
ncbi:MAG TPA: PQQ-binding-like beta-propeller repeat protein [Kiritimatiellia bacterium]|nr:PQQ-binding-like beta-propeller repeat protein [Kiritimatiellia bacterium]HPS09423.1 PQQ-binding-like beta-propeller repeat protein [Kiritimatiellia bacterium]